MRGTRFHMLTQYVCASAKRHGINVEVITVLSSDEYYVD